MRELDKYFEEKSCSEKEKATIMAIVGLLNGCSYKQAQEILYKSLEITGEYTAIDASAFQK